MFSIYDIIKEADDDETGAPADQGEAGGDVADDENFDIDASLDVDTDDTDDAGEAVDDTGAEADEGGEEGGGEETSSSGSSGGGIDTTSDEEPVQGNTDLFTTLSAEEQAIKIGELKTLYKELYNRIDDTLHRIDDMDFDEFSLGVMSKVSLTLHTLKKSLTDYFDKFFNLRSYGENDFKYNEFLLVLKSVTSIVDDLAKGREKNLGRKSDSSNEKNITFE